MVLLRTYPTNSDPATRPLERFRERALELKPGTVGVGIFVPNESWAYWPTTADLGTTDWTYDYNRQIVRLAEAIGLKFVFPAGRWKGLPGDEIDWRGVSLDTVTLTAGLLEATERITVLTTIHTNVFNPVVAAKLGADLDQIGDGRWGLNIVSGWGVDEFRSFGIPLLDHKERYVYTREWLDIVEGLWEKGELTHHGKHFQIEGAVCRPRPQQMRPLIVNAGQSYTGMKFAAERADYLFSRGERAAQFAEVNSSVGRGVGFIGTRKLILGNTEAEARERAHQIAASLDAGAVCSMLLASGAQQDPAEARALVEDPDWLWNYVLEDGIVGAPQRAAEELAEWACQWDVAGICLTLVDYERDLELFAEKVLPVLEKELESRGRRLDMAG